MMLPWIMDRPFAPTSKAVRHLDDGSTRLNLGWIARRS